MPAICHIPGKKSRSDGNNEDTSFLLQNQINAARAESWLRNCIRDSNAQTPLIQPLTELPITSIRPINSSVSSESTCLWETFTSDTLVPLPINSEAPYPTLMHSSCKSSSVKKPQNAFLIFTHYLNVQGTFLTTKQQTEVSAKAGELWGILGREAQQKFYDLAEVEELRMQRECKALEAQGELRVGAERSRGQEEKAMAEQEMGTQVREPSLEVAVYGQLSSNSYQFEQLQDLLSHTLVKAPRIKKEVRLPTSVSFNNDSVSLLSSSTSTPLASSSSLSSDPLPTESELSSSACCSSQASETSVPPQPRFPDPSTEWWQVEDGFFERTIDPVAEDPFFPSANAAILPSYVAADPGTFSFAISNSSNSTTLPASALSTGFDAMYPPLQNYNNPLTSDWNGGKYTCNVSGSNHSSPS